MNISYNWLRRYIDVDMNADQVARHLTRIGLEVGTVEKVQTIKGGMEGLAVGEVLTCVNHENSDHLHITTVRVEADKEPLQIVCGAPNVAVGQKVIVATVGTVLYDGDKPFTIKKSKMRGVESFGMICAADEIGIGTDHEGIMVLPADTPVGMPACDYFGIKDDYVIEVDITPNRADAISHWGVARDLYAWCIANDIRATLNRPEVHFEVKDGGNKTGNIEIEIRDEERCPRYAGILIRNVKVAESPDWLKEALNVIGLRPINNIADITNYVMYAIGQPLHAFDADRIAGNKVVIRTAREGVKLITLDGVERTLTADDLMICDNEKEMCIAGVLGGKDSGISNETRNVLIEVAYFNPVSVRKTARRHGLNTDASFRFERGIDPANTIWTLRYTTDLIKEIAGGEPATEYADIYPKKIENFKVTVSNEKIDTLIGKHIPEETLDKIFKGLEMKVLSHNDGVYELEIPAYRVDVQRDVDVIEDILRIYGYNNVELSESLHANLSFTPAIDSNLWQRKISEQLTACGFNEILNNSLSKASYYEGLTTLAESNCVRIMNSQSQGLNVMRQTLLFGGLESIAHNANRQNANIRFYEFGNCYHYNAERECEERLGHYSEEYHLAMFVSGNKSVQSWATAVEPASFYQLKAYVQNVLVRMGVNLRRTKINEVQDDIFFEAIEICTAGGKRLAIVGRLNPGIRKTFGIDAEVYYADIVWQMLLKECGRRKISYAEIPRFPSVSRDLSLMVDKGVRFADIEKIAYECEKKLLTSVTLFDVYEGKNLEAGKKSYAVNFTLQDPDKTLNDKQIDAIMQKITKSIIDRLGAVQR
ncbi:MAG: phenylalanine--tRNA ligase subunit beta [bacterium]|nr:phenylalanine--tRNA ligase subunit beta [Candidatus Minthenecus merdequi]